MPSKATLSAGAVLVAVLVIAAYVRHRQKAGFVGAMARTPGMQNCLAFGGPHQRTTHFNRCAWV